MEDRVCRNCHESGGDLIAPCSCSGSMRWVHRDCLDKWRSVSQNPMSFSTCDVCGQKYRLRPKKIGAWPYIRLYILIILDIVSVLAVVTGVIALCGLVVFGTERATHFSELFGNHHKHYYYGDSSSSSFSSGVTKAEALLHNAFFLIFVGGLALLCFIIGCCYIMYSIIKCICGCCDECCTTTYTATTYDYNAWFPIWWWWYVTSPPPNCYCGCCCDCLDCCINCAECTCDGCNGDLGRCDCGNCDCSGCDCNCSDSSCNCDSGGDSGGAGAALLIVLAIIVAIIICIGAVVGTFLVVSFIVRMVSGHLAVLNRQKKAQALVVVDLSEEDNNKDLADGEDVVLLSPGEGSDVPHPPPPSATCESGVSYAPSKEPGTSGADVLILPPEQPQPAFYSNASAPSAPGGSFL